ncbi:FkbM family methyltransferase [Candidatus Pelagibacter bacterium]|jgi:FkbM family methyltransferase|nr:FkbM family methyltransferase [Candidatus Pelagibacter bacterium]
MSKKIYKIFRSLIKVILPIIFKILIKLKLNRRVINFLSEKSYKSNEKYNFVSLIKKLIKNKKIIALDVGAQGGFNSDFFFPEKYNLFFEDILIEPIKTEALKLKEKKFVINKGLWNKKEKKTLYILDKRLGSSSMYKPDEKKFDLYNMDNKDFDNFKITRTIEIECDTMSNQLSELDIKSLDYLKIDTQGAELEILKGIGNFRPLLIKIEAHFFSMYKNVPDWNKLVNYLGDLNYVLIDWKEIGGHNTRVPVEADMIFIPNFNNETGKNLIKDNAEKFISLMLIFGQIKLLQILMKRFEIDNKEIENLEDNYFN